MESKLYVGNLSYSTTEDDLRTLFTQAGTVSSVALIKDRDSGQSKGFAFVEMSTQVEAEKAISTFNGYHLGDRELKVSLARHAKSEPEAASAIEAATTAAVIVRNAEAASATKPLVSLIVYSPRQSAGENFLSFHRDEFVLRGRIIARRTDVRTLVSKR